jgi:hypothetical protein
MEIQRSKTPSLKTLLHVLNFFKYPKKETPKIKRVPSKIACGAQTPQKEKQKPSISVHTITKKY